VPPSGAQDQLSRVVSEIAKAVDPLLPSRSSK
jgi:hypothetical protein